MILISPIDKRADAGKYEISWETKSGGALLTLVLLKQFINGHYVKTMGKPIHSFFHDMTQISGFESYMKVTFYLHSLLHHAIASG